MIWFPANAKLHLTWWTFFSESSGSGGVEAKAEIAGDDEMSEISKNPSDDFPNQEKNQYWTVYW